MPDTQAPLQLFALEHSRDFGRRVADALGRPLARHEERGFDDGEHKARPLESVRGRDVHVISSLFSDPPGAGALSVDDKLTRLLFFCGALRDAGAARVTAVTPYLCYMRKDRRTKPRDPLTTRYVAALFEAVGVDHVVTLDVHQPAAFENAFRIATTELTARPLFADHVAPLIGEGGAVVVSPDIGGAKRAEAFAALLTARLGREVGMAFVEKHRSEGVVTGGAAAGDIKGNTALILDDLIASGGTMTRAAGACRDLGAVRAVALATHGVFTEAEDMVTSDAFDAVAVTDSVPPTRLADDARERLTVLDAAPLVAEAIRRLHAGGEVTALAD